MCVCAVGVGSKKWLPEGGERERKMVEDLEGDQKKKVQAIKPKFSD